jgi:hypothetical protein
LLYLLLRHATLLEYATASFNILSRHKMITPADRLEPELIDIRSEKSTSTIWRQLSRPVAGLTGRLSIGDYLRRLRRFDDDDLRQFGEFKESLRLLQDRPIPVLEQLVTETLDLCSHRLDAWITSFATKRMVWLRQKKATGVYLGGYGWVEDLRPVAPRRQVKPPIGEIAPLSVSDANAGFIHAPSLNQAATAAILRNGALSHRDKDGKSDLALDLSSERVRLAHWLLEGIRNGQPLAALLGYRFERGLHESHPGLKLDQFIGPFRQLAPFGAEGLKDAGSSASAAGIDRVVDGLSLLQMWRTATIPFGKEGLPATGTPEHEAILAELAALGDAIDAIGDATIAESVYQVLQGNPLRAGAALDWVSGGDSPLPELEVVRTPRTGVGLTHRIVVLFPGDLDAGSLWGASSERAKARRIREIVEPRLNAWIAQLLGDPARYRCRAEYLDADDKVSGSREVKLNELELSPIDVLYMANGESRRSGLEDLLFYYLARTRPPEAPPTATVRLNLTRSPDWPEETISFSELMEIARAICRLVKKGRGLDARDLSLPEDGALPGIDPEELKTRADRGAAALAQILNELDATEPEQLRESLLSLAYFGIANAIPHSADGDTAQERAILLAQARALRKEAARRLEKAGQQNDDLARVREIFGEDFPSLPLFAAQNGDELNNTFSASRLLQGDDPFAALAWFQRIGRVRDDASQLGSALIYAEALGNTSPDFRVGQLPYRENDRWVALPSLPDKPMTGGRLSIVAHSTAAIDFRRPLSGLLIDEWAEVVPGDSEITGMAFHFDGPGACAPQAILLALPPKEKQTWDMDTLAATLLETLELAKLRAVDPDTLGEVGHFLPALYFAANAAGDTVATDFLRASDPASQGD